MKTKRVAIITGAAGGIGKASALRFAKEGYALSLVDIAEDKLSEVVEDIQKCYPDSNVLSLVGDLSDLDFVLNIAHQTYAQFQSIDVLINNAAWRSIESMRNIQAESWDKTLAICLRAPAFLSKEAVSIMEQNKIHGVIINVSSIMSDRAGGFSPAYVAAKGGLESLTYELAALYGPSGIRVLSVCPGNVNTPLNTGLKDQEERDISSELVAHVESLTPLQRSAEAEEIAEAMLWLSGPQASFITGTNIHIDGGFSTNFNSYPMKKLQFPKEF